MALDVLATLNGAVACAAALTAAGALRATWRARAQRDAARSSMQSCEARSLHVRAALNNMSQGLCMFDASAHVVVCNEAYLRMYALSADIVKPGCSLRALIEHRRDAGLFDGDIDQYVASILATAAAGQSECHVGATADGRAINIVHQPIAGGGWVVTHEDISERRRAEEKIAYMARHDALTDLANRVQFTERIEYEFARARRSNESFAIFIVDLDHFKNVNDSLGHPVGDTLLCKVGERLRAATRDSDMVARIGGDEFAILQGLNGRATDAVISLAQRLLRGVGAPYDILGHQIDIGASIGVAIGPHDGSEASELLKNADLALYRAKSDGRNSFRFFEQAMDIAARSRHAIETDLRRAVANQEFEIYYQTVVDVETKATSGVEALVRWRHPTRGMVQPNEFIALAEETGLIVPIGEWVLKTACRQAAQWPAHLKLAVNLSAAQFKRGNLVAAVRDALAESGLAPQRLELEITESVLLYQNVFNLAILRGLKALGVSIVLDDFGTGFSSLSYLRMFPFDTIKIDRSFVGEMSAREDCAAIVSAVAGLSRNLGIATTAEGVETPEQFALLRAAGCTMAQGYMFSQPRPAAELDFSPAAQVRQAS